MIKSPLRVVAGKRCCSRLCACPYKYLPCEPRSWEGQAPPNQTCWLPMNESVVYIDSSRSPLFAPADRAIKRGNSIVSTPRFIKEIKLAPWRPPSRVCSCGACPRFPRPSYCRSPWPSQSVSQRSLFTTKNDHHHAAASRTSPLLQACLLRWRSWREPGELRSGNRSFREKAPAAFIIKGQSRHAKDCRRLLQYYVGTRRWRPWSSPAAAPTGTRIILKETMWGCVFVDVHIDGKTL
jgi:hypothetical protein